MIDDNDWQAIGTGVIRLAAVVALVLVGALTAGAALRVFQWASGI